MGRLAQLFNPLISVPILSAGVISSLAVIPFSSAAASETRTYVVSGFWNATYSTKDDCQGGEDVDQVAQYKADLQALGMSSDKIEKIMAGYPGRQTMNILNNRGRIDGKPTNVYADPASAIDPKLHMIDGRYAFGFNLDGKGADSPNSFEDPVTHEKGINNQLFRVLGCSTTFRGEPERTTPPYHYSFAFRQLRNSFPAWLVTITGDDLSKDGPVTVTVDRSLDHVLTDSNEDTESNTTFRIDPTPGSVNVFHGQLQNGVINITDHHDFHLIGDPDLVTVLDLSDTHLRLTMDPNGGLKGLVGGYQPWSEIFLPMGHSGENFEETGMDIPGLYYSLRRLADADPDPKTGQNQRISVAWQFEAVPAFVVPASDPYAATLSESKLLSQAADPVPAPALLSAASGR